jgi:hypothetical protein
LSVIELLVVIAIIAILAAILFPVFAKAWNIRNVMLPYTKNLDIYLCPKVSTPETIRYAKGYLCSWIYRAKDLQDVRGAPIDRGLGGYLNDTARPRPPMTLAEIDKPAEKIAFYDMTWGFGEPDRAKRKALGYVPHGDGSLYIHADGHAKFGVLGAYWYPEGYAPNKSGHLGPSAFCRQPTVGGPEP